MFWEEISPSLSIHGFEQSTPRCKPNALGVKSERIIERFALTVLLREQDCHP
jgi:hypothetical protein